METKRKYTQLKNTEYKDKLIQVKLTSKDYNNVIDHATQCGYTSVSAFLRHLIQQELANNK